MWVAALSALLIAAARAARAAATGGTSATSVVLFRLLVTVLSVVLQFHLVELLTEHLDQLVNTPVDALALQIHLSIPLLRQAPDQFTHYQTLLWLHI